MPISLNSLFTYIAELTANNVPDNKLEDDTKEEHHVAGILGGINKMIAMEITVVFFTAYDTRKPQKL